MVGDPRAEILQAWEAGFRVATIGRFRTWVLTFEVITNLAVRAGNRLIAFGRFNTRNERIEKQKKDEY